MGILQEAYRTYETQAHRIGMVLEGEEPLVSVSHTIQNAHIEIELTADGQFQNARAVPNEQRRTIIPVTIESSSRTSTALAPHPLSDQLRYLFPFGEDKFTAYLAHLKQWAESEFSHPKVRAVLRYIEGLTILTDLTKAGVISLDEQGNPGDGKIQGNLYSKCLVRWKVLTEQEGVRSACWEDKTLFESYTAFYAHQCASEPRDICLISGKEDMICDAHPKGVVAAENGAKLVSSNDDKAFTYRGRFTDKQQAYCLGYDTSQKAHNALRWLVANQGIRFGSRTFLGWSPGGAELPIQYAFGLSQEEESTDFEGYKKQLNESLRGYRKAFKVSDQAVIAALDAATTGRLAVTYYNKMKASDFLDRLEHWYTTFCWNRGKGVWAPSLRLVVNCAYGTQRGAFLETDTDILGQYVQRLVHCVIDRQSLPLSLVQSLSARASTPLAYTPTVRRSIVTTACAVIRKYRNDQRKREEWTLALDTSNQNRSYLFGRLLAVAELAEKATYRNGEERETQAIRMQAVFSQRPLYAWRILRDKLIPYLERLTPGLRAYYKNRMAEIADQLDPNDLDLNKRLEDIYILGYDHQLRAMTTKKLDSKQDDPNEEETEHEPAEE